jgi:hypothetical protein
MVITSNFVVSGLNLVIDYDTGKLNWFQEVSDGASMILLSVTISKYNNSLVVHYHSGICYNLLGL